MSTPITSVVRTAATPVQASVFVALLRAEGIPATTDGESLTDEVAMSRRLMNTAGTRILVPTASLARAREVLDRDGSPPVDLDELTAQALAAEAPEREVPPRDPAQFSVWALGPKHLRWLLLGAFVFWLVLQALS